MKFRKILNPKLILVFVALTLISCNNIFVGKNKTNELNRIETNKLTRIETNKLEAKLLVKVSKNNLIILQICENIEDVEIVQNVEIENDIKILIESLEKTHFELSENYNELAEEKLISIPIEIRINNQIGETNTVDNLKENLNEILNKIDCQIKLLNRLGEISNQIEFKVLATKDSIRLKSNTSKIEIVLSELKDIT